MKLIPQILGGAFLLLSVVVHAQDTAPASLAGKSGVVVISNGTGIFDSIGGYRISFSTSTYSTSPLSPGTPGAGTYLYSKSGPNTAAIVINDSNVGISASQVLIFTSPSTATFTLTSSRGSQTGTFVLEGVTSTVTVTNTVTTIVPGGLSNMSVRAVVPANGQIIPGLVLDQASRVLVRVSGPALAAFGVPGTLANPKFTLFAGASSVGSNDDWGTNQAAVAAAATRTGAFSFANGSRDAALVIDLAAGNYTCVITGDAGTTGEVLLEVYRVPN